MADAKMTDKDYVKRFIAELVRLNGGEEMPGRGTSLRIYGNGAGPAYREADNDPHLPDDPEAAARADYAKWGEPVPQREIPDQAPEPVPAGDLVETGQPAPEPEAEAPAPAATPEQQQ